MSLLDLKSDLSKYRWKGPTAPVDANSRTPRALTYGDNFSSFQPISNTFINRGDLPIINTPKEVDLIGKLDDTRLDDIQNRLTDSDVASKLGNTRLDDIQKPKNINILVNSVSQLSPQNKDYNSSTVGRTSVTDVVSQLSRIQSDVVQTNITESKVDVIKKDNQTGNIRIPDVNITPQEQILNKSIQAPFIIKDSTEATNNIRVPLIRINTPRQTKDREEESPNINNNPGALDLLINNDPLSILQSSKLDLNGTPIKYGGETKFVGDLSDLNLDAVRITNPSGRHENDSNTDLSNKNGQKLDQFTNDNAVGFTTNATPLQTDYKTNSSTLGYDTVVEANYFDITNTYTRDGFHAFSQPGESTKYKTDSSVFDWDGNTPKAPSVNYFDVNNKNTTEGFHTFSLTREQTRYKINSSDFDWDGSSKDAPSINYFDRNNLNTIQGFHTFAFEKEGTKYKTDSSRFDWDGTRSKAPSVNYFDLVKRSTVRGFHNFASTKEPSSYATSPVLASLSAFNNRAVILQNNATEFDWNGFRTNAPAVSFFDLSNPFSTWRGFHTFAFTQEPTSYQTSANGQLVLAGGRPVTLGLNATRFDWNGFRRNAPSVNYFDFFGLNTWRGFHNFAFTQEPTSYQTTANGQIILAGGTPVTLTLPATRFDWDGFRAAAPAVNFFDLTTLRTWRGFHTFAFEREPTSYQTIANGQLVLQGGPPVTLTNTATRFDWDGFRAAAAINTVNFFDLSSPFSTWRGFHAFALSGPFEPTSYQTTANGQLILRGGPPVTLLGGPFGPTQLDWDGLRAAAPAVNFFDLTAPFNTWRGFHTFALSGPFEPTSYRNTAQGQLVLQGGPPVTLLSGPLGTSQLDWDGLRAAAPAVNSFDLFSISTWRGFHTFSLTQEPTSYQTTANGQLVTRFGTPVTLTTGPLGATQFDWDGTLLNAPAVNYMDFGNQWTFQGFHTFATEREPTSYQTQTFGNVVVLNTRTTSLTSGPWTGLRANVAFQVVNYFDLSAPFRTRNNGTRGFHAFAQPLEPTAFRTIAATPNSRTLPTFFGSPIDLHWSGARNTAPSVNWFDQNNVRTTRGFHTFAVTREPTSYQTQLIGNALILRPTATNFDWNGTRNPLFIPTVNYFDLSSPFATWRGFHSFAQLGGLVPTSYDTTANGQLVPIGGPPVTLRFRSTRLDWDGLRGAAPAVNYFDVFQFRTWRGFHNFARSGGLEPTSFQTTANGRLVFASNPPVTLTVPASGLDWDGLRGAAPAVNYFDLSFPFSTWRGFHRFSRSGPFEPTSYRNNLQGQVISPFSPAATLTANATNLDWNGFRRNAPAVNFFDQTAPFSTWRGFNTFALGGGLEPTSYRTTSQGQLVLQSGPSVALVGGPLGTTQFDWDGLDPYSMRTTNFFGFTPTTRFGFMVNMSQFDGTAYPIINPRFTANTLNLPGFPQRLQRFALRTFRQILQPLQTSNLEQFAPLTLGGKTISNFRSTLDVQIPAVTIQKLNLNIATNRVRLNPRANNFTKRYTTGGGVDIRPSVVDGNMESWSNINNQLIDRQHSKYSLNTEAYNDDIFIGQPFIDGSLKGPDFLKISKFDDGLVRGGVIANTVRTYLDSKRIGKFLLSGKGILWNIKQAGLQAMNPNVDSATKTNPVERFLSLGKLPTQTYNPLSVPFNIAGRSALIGRRFTRHGILMDGVSGRYESVSIERALNSNAYSYFDAFDSKSNNNYNRLIGLVKELLPNSYDPIRENKIPSKSTKLEIARVSSGFGGPNSLLGFFGTTINRATHPFKIVNTTEYFPQRVDIGLGLDREVFFSGGYENSAVRPDTYSAMLLREIKEYQGDMYGLILSAANITPQSFTPTWKENQKNIFNAKNIKFQLYSQERIKGTKVFEFKKQTTSERFTAMNSGYIPFRDYNESIAEEVFFTGPTMNQTYFDRLFGSPDGEYTKYNGEIFGIILGSTLGQNGSFAPYWKYGPALVTPKDFNIPLNKYDKNRILNLRTFDFKESPIIERGRAVDSTNIISRTNLTDLASDTMFFKGSILNQNSSIVFDSYSETLRAERLNFSGNTFGLTLAIALNDKILGRTLYWKDSPNLIYDSKNLRINSKTKTLIEKIQPFKFLIRSESDRYIAVTSETATDSSLVTNAQTLLTLLKFGTAEEGKVSYGQKLKSDYRDTSGTFKGLILAARELLLNKFDPGSFGPYVDANTKVRIEKSLPFEFRYPSDYERLEAITADKLNRERNKKMAFGPNADTLSDTKDDFITSDYDQFGLYRDKNTDEIKSRRSRSTDPIDFRSLFPKISKTTDHQKFSPSSDVIDFNDLDMEKLGKRSAGFGNPGRRNLLRAFPFVANIKYTSGIANENATAADKFAKNYKAAGYPANRKYGGYPTKKEEVKTLHQKTYSDAFSAGDPSFWEGFRGDRINIIDWKRQEVDLSKNTVYEHETNGGINNTNFLGGAQDSIQFYFSGVDLKASAYRPTEAIVFRAYIDSIVDNHKPTWTPIKYIGRADPVYSYDGYEREISFGFTIHIGSRDELKATWRKLNMLASWTSPDYIDPGFMKAPICRLNIGNLYRKFPGFISTLSYTFDNTQTTWETAKLAEDLDLTSNNKIKMPDGTEVSVGELSRPGALELPKTILVQCTFVTFNIYRPQWDCVFYSLFDDTVSSGYESGLVPLVSDYKVNYFRTHDDLAMNHPMNALLCSVVPPPPEETKITRKDEDLLEPPPPEPTTTPPPTPTPTGTPTSTGTGTPRPTPTPTLTTTPVVNVPPCVCRIDFCFDEDREITPPSRTAIRTYVNWLEKCPDLRVRIEGFCSKERNNPQYNIHLSWARAVTVANLLVEEFGIDPKRLEILGKGFGKKGVDKGIVSPWSDQKNRRVAIVPISGEKPGCEPPKPCKDSECPTTAKCWRKDGTKFWRVGPHYFTGQKLIEQNGRNVGESYCGWPLAYEPNFDKPSYTFKIPSELDQKTTFNAYTKLNFIPDDEGTKTVREVWHDFYILQQPNNSDTPYWPKDLKKGSTRPPVPEDQVDQRLWKAWFTPIKDAKQTFEFAHLKGSQGACTYRLRTNPNASIDIWQRRKDRNDWFQTKYSGYQKNKFDKGHNSDGLDDYTYINNPNI
jgi:hypothetical protein